MSGVIKVPCVLRYEIYRGEASNVLETFER